MITRSLSRHHGGERRSPVVGPKHKGVLPRHGGAGHPDPHTGTLTGTREQAERATVSNNYWSSSTLATNPNNAWNVNFNNGNVNNNNKNNNNYVRAVRGGLWSALCLSGGEGPARVLRRRFFRSCPVVPQCSSSVIPAVFWRESISGHSGCPPTDCGHDVREAQGRKMILLLSWPLFRFSSIIGVSFSFLLVRHSRSLLAGIHQRAFWMPAHRLRA